MSDFESVKQRVSAALAGGQAKQGVEELVAWADGGGKAPDRAGETWLHRTLGLGLLGLSRAEDALPHLARALDLEPRDATIGVAYGRLLFDLGRGDEAVRVLKGVLIHHKAALDGPVLGNVYRTLGRHYLGQEQIKEARAALGDAVRADPTERANLDAMLDLLAVLPAEEAPRARRMLLSRISAATDQAYVLERLAEVARDGGDVAEARRLTEQALALLPDSPEALRRKAELASAGGDPGGAAAALWEAHQLAPAGEATERAAELRRIDALLVEAGSEPARRLAVLEALLELEPACLECFEAVTRLCAEAEDWAELSRAYKRMIRRVRALDPPPDERLLPMLWVNLGELYGTHLGQPDEGIKALAVAAGLRPKDAALRRRIIDLARGRRAVYEEAYRAATELAELQPDVAAVRRERAQLAVLTGRYDVALLILRVLKADNEWDEAFDPVYGRLHRSNLKLPERRLSDKRRRKRLRPQSQSYVLDSLMAIGGVAFQRLFAHDLASHGLTDKDRLDPESRLLFNQIFTQAAETLGLSPQPAVFVKPGLKGMVNAALDRPALLVGNDLMAGRDPREIAFVVGQQLCLQRPEYVLTTIHEAAALKLIVLVLTNYIEPSVPVADSKTATTLKRELERRLSPELEKHLRETVTSLVSQHLDVNVDAWVQSVADEAMYTGLLFCDDFEVADEHVLRDTGVRGVSGDAARRQRLRWWAMSEHHLSLRRALGLARRVE